MILLLHYGIGTSLWYKCVLWGVFVFGQLSYRSCLPGERQGSEDACDVEPEESGVQTDRWRRSIVRRV
jgi:hypothetical protein